jgi:hypothetical protein
MCEDMFYTNEKNFFLIKRGNNLHYISLYFKMEVIFLDKEYALISRRYQLHPASATTQYPSGHTDAHSQKKKKKNYEKEKSRFSEQFLVAAAELTPPR